MSTITKIVFRYPMKNLFALLALSFLTMASLEAMPAQVIVLRHAEKANQGNSLSLKGRERAAALAPYLSETESLLKYGPPVAIYAVAASAGDSPLWSIETVRPLAEKLKLPLIDKYGRDNYKFMVEEIKNNPAYHAKTIVICWEHLVIPEIARAFAALQTPNRWTSEVYDRLWIITFSTTGRANFQNLPQRLLYGDTLN